MASVLFLACAREEVRGDLVTDYGLLFNDNVEIKFPHAVNYNNPLYDFPLLVRLSEGSPSGFTYSRVDAAGADIRFVFVEGSVSNAVPYEIDTWNTNGVSTLWVRVPKFSNKSNLKLVMYWAPDSPDVLPTVVPNAPRAVWNGYAAVWHMNDAAESTTNALVSAVGAQASTQPGVIGSALGTRVSAANGAILTTPSSAAIDGLTSGAYTISGWMRVNLFAGTPWLYSARTTPTDDAFGAQFAQDAGGLSLGLHADGSTVDAAGTNRFAQGSWYHFAVVHESATGKHTVYLNGSEFYGVTVGRTDKSGSDGLSFGGLLGESAFGTLNGDLDDVRIYPAKRVPRWVTNEYAQVVTPDYLVFTNFFSTGNPVYVQQKKPGDDPSPGPPQDVSVADYAGQATFTPSSVPAGTVLTNFVAMIKVWEGEPEGFVPKDLPFGTEDIRFFDQDGNVLDFEIELWDVNFESFFWVRVPELSPSTRITMCWGLLEGRTLPPVDAANVWQGYAGVWHMADERDSTTNAAKAAFGERAVLNPYGLAGKAAGTVVSGQKGAILDIEANAAIDALTNGPFTVTGWVYLNQTNTNHGALFSRATASDPAWGAQFCGGSTGDSSALEMQAGSSGFQAASELDRHIWYRFDFVYAADRLSFYIDGEKKGESVQARTLLNGSSGKLSIGGFASAAEGVLGENTLNGYIDEFRLLPGVQTATERLIDVEQCSDEDFYLRGAATWDDTAILQNRWRVLPSLSKTEWNEGEDPAVVSVGEPWYGVSSVSYLNRSTGAVQAEMPTEGGDYRAVFFCPPVGRYSSLTYTVNFRIRIYRPTHNPGAGDGRILLLNSDRSIADGLVEVQAYNDTAQDLDRPFWEHDVDTGYDYTSTSLHYNFCGGMRHTYYAENGWTRLWDLIDVRYGNTYNNADEAFERTGSWEEWENGLEPDRNYLPWNPEGGCLVDDMGLPAEGWHEYAAQAVLCNSLKASINSTLYTNGIGTIYFDCVNSHTDDATNGYYKLVIEMATNAIDRVTGRPSGIPTDQAIAATHPVWDEAAQQWTVSVHDPYKFADWRPLDMHVRVVNGETMTDLCTTNALTLALTGGGSYTNFYRIYVPVDCFGNARFRIIRRAINPDYTIAPDVRSLILVDNVICSAPTDRARLEPRGHYDPSKVKRETVGYEGAFNPSYPSVSDGELHPRVKATLPSGEAPKLGTLSSVLMHYRWRYLDQQTTDWMTADIDPATLVGVEPILWPRISGDLEYWYEGNQAGEFYEYADYSGLELGLPGYSEEVTSVTNRAPTYATYGKDWFTRIRDGKSTCGEVKLFVRRGDAAPVESVEMFVARDQIWRGCLLATNAVPEGLQFRFEIRNRQDDSLDEFQYNTNFWYLADEAQALPVSGSVVAGTTNDWGRIPCDGATGHLMFQVDESTRALTIVHADWQDFNGWNDAHRDYFSGASTDDVTKRGTSAAQREYLCDANQWDDDCATNELWTETFSPGSYTGYDFYVPFLTETSPNGFAVGEGMWVRGAYADPASGMSLQMAGQGRGYVQMTDPLEYPRGLEAVRFSARIAQAVSPEDLAYYKGSPTESAVFLNDYSFITRAAFDLNANSNFTGNASLSLAAFCQPGESCYEARWEQLGGDIEDGSGTILGPTARSQRLALYRWHYVGREWKATELYAATNSGPVCSWAPSIAPRAIPAAYSITNGLMPFMVGAYDNEAAGYTLIIAAVSIPGEKDPTENVIGHTADAELSYLGSEKAKGWLYLVYRDTDPNNRLRCGTYGVLASNCEGVFVRPQYHAGLVSWKSNVSETRNLATQVYPTATPAATAAFKAFAERECVEDIADHRWRVPDGRMVSYYETLEDNRNYVGAAVVTQTVDVYTAPIGTSSWTTTPVASRTLTGFGKPGVLQDTVFNFWSTDDSSVRIRAGGTLAQVRTDVVVDNIQITQWRGQDWLGSTEIEKAQGGLTNFVYTSGWISNGALQLSPKRTPSGSPSSLRVPLCDGRGSGKMRRGLGLGYLSFEYRNAQSNANLLVQIATNGVSALNLIDYTLDPGKGALAWETITNFDFSVMTPEERAAGYLSCSPGLHGVVGTMRIIVDPTLVDSVKTESDPERFGSVEIVSALFRDEPPLDKGCWWGFNLRTIGDVTDVEQRMYLPDNPYRTIHPSLDEIGRSLALNNSITDDCDPAELAKDPDAFAAHMPFLQTPTFSSNIVGEVSFKARKYTLQKNAQCAEVTLYGTRAVDVDKLRDRDWEILNVFIVSNTTYESYRFKADTSAGYRAFRFAVTGVDGVLWPGPDPVCGEEPVRVLIDDVLVSEAVQARLAFRNVGAFRHYLSQTTYVPDVPSPAEQPICNEGWGVQTEVYAAMLGEEIDKSTPPRVRLHYYKGVAPWGYQQWKDRATSAWLTAATDTNGFYRSSATASPGAVIPMSSSSEVVQYMLEVVYTIVNSETGGRSLATNWLETVDWDVPSWYNPIDYNRMYGGDAPDRFAAFSIIDPIAPGWAWINEINLFGQFSGSYQNSDKTKQFVEVTKPTEYDLNGWTLRMLSAKTLSAPSSEIITNNVAVFGRTVSAQKAGGPNCDYMSFIVVGNPEGSTSLTGIEWDGGWNFSKIDSKVFNTDGTLGHYYPVGIQLVRPSGVVEHEVAILGTNAYNDVAAAIAWQYDSTNLVRLVKASGGKSNIFALPDDRTTATSSTGVHASRGENELCWNNTMTCTPGDLNQGQVIDPDHPTPGGELIMVFASVDTTFGHIVQTVGAGTNTTVMQTVTLQSGSAAGLDIHYTVDPWYELGAVKETENKTPRVPIISTNAVRQYTVNVAKGATRNVSVVASATVDSRLKHEYGLDENNRYTPAVLNWLERHKDVYGNDFYDWQSGEIELAKFVALSGTVTNDMSLTQMYWLDIDPTIGGMYFRAGMVRPPQQVVWKKPTYDPQHDPMAYTNLRVGVYMAISNDNGRAQVKLGREIWAPYVLRGLGLGELSWDYSPDTASAGSWTSETFKVTGFLNNGLTHETDAESWIPLRYFVFKENSFDVNYEAEIDVSDPFSTRSPAYSQGWYRWVAEHGGVKPPVYLSWNIDTRLQPITAEILAPTNRLVNLP